MTKNVTMGNIFKKIEGNLKKITSIYATKKGAGGSSDPRSVLDNTTALDGGIATYRRNLDSTYKYYGFNEVEGWGYKIQNSDGEAGEGTAAGAMGTGTNRWLATSSHVVPSALSDGKQGNVLCFLACWMCGGYYYFKKPFKFKQGHHTVTFRIYVDKASYNINTMYTGLTDDVSGFYIKYSIGNTSFYNGNSTYKDCVLEFDVTEEEEELYICFGYKSNNYGSGSQPMVALDSVEGLPGEGANELVNICKVYNGSRLIKDFCGGNDDDGGDYSGQYFTIEALEDGYIPMNTTTEIQKTEWSINGGEWEKNKAMIVKAGDKIRFRRTASNAIYNQNAAILNISFKFNVYGNINSMYAGDNFKTDLTTYDHMFQNWFQQSKVVDASNLVLPYTETKEYICHYMFGKCELFEKAPKVLPAMQLAEHCYSDMFHDCTSLTDIPELPATTLAKRCYMGMFHNCSSLKEVPELPSTVLANECYDSMFRGCTSLVNAQEILPATHLADSCYKEMFRECSILEKAPALPAMRVYANSYDGMFYGCSALQNCPELPATTLDYGCYSYMFCDCISIREAPELPARDNIPGYAYYHMFSGCTSLVKAPEILPAEDLLEEYCYNSMFKNCYSLERAPELPAVYIPSYAYADMFLYCYNLNYIKCLAMGMNDDSVSGWVIGVSPTGTFVKLSGIEYPWDGIPNGWTVEEVD